MWNRAGFQHGEWRLFTNCTTLPVQVVPGDRHTDYDVFDSTTNGGHRTFNIDRCFGNLAFSRMRPEQSKTADHIRSHARRGLASEPERCTALRLDTSGQLHDGMLSWRQRVLRQRETEAYGKADERLLDGADGSNRGGMEALSG